MPESEERKQRKAELARQYRAADPQKFRDRSKVYYDAHKESERARKLAPDNASVLDTGGMVRLRAGRDLGLGLVNAMPRMRRGLIREAAGLTGDLPRLLQGRPI